MPNPEDILDPLWNDPRGIRWNEFLWNGPLVPPPFSLQIQHKPHKNMPKQFYMSKTEIGKQQWLDRFAGKLADASNGYATKYGVSAANVTALANGRLWVDAMMAFLPGLRDAAQAFTEFKNALFNGNGAIAAPPAPVFTAPAVPPFAGIFILAAAIAQQIKNHPSYTVADGEDLGIEGAAMTTPDAGGDSPDFSKSHLASGGHPELKWIRGPHTATRIMVNRADGKGEVLLTVSTLSHYTDMVLPAAGTTAIYTYRGIFLMGDEEFGQWSQPFQITVRG